MSPQAVLGGAEGRSEREASHKVRRIEPRIYSWGLCPFKCTLLSSLWEWGKRENIKLVLTGNELTGCLLLSSLKDPHCPGTVGFLSSPSLDSPGKIQKWKQKQQDNKREFFVNETTCLPSLSAAHHLAWEPHRRRKYTSWIGQVKLPYNTSQTTIPRQI